MISGFDSVLTVAVLIDEAEDLGGEFFFGIETVVFFLEADTGEFVFGIFFEDLDDFFGGFGREFAF